MAGVTADAHHHGGTTTDHIGGCFGDIQLAQRYAEQLLTDRSERHHWRGAVERTAREVVHDAWPLIERLADALIERRELDGDEIADVLGQDGEDLRADCEVLPPWAGVIG